ncbi:T9SS type A sorting domain-containing protein [candidate division KSB1 bacterium]|nr:T9SS type A sorting domain-containing protein [candidate division KSB1 bacterium]
MKKKEYCSFLFLFFCLAFWAHSQEPPFKDFRLPNDELLTIFIGESDWNAPYIQCVDLVNDNFVFHNLCENNTHMVTRMLNDYNAICGTSGNFDANKETIELIIGSQNCNEITLQHAICNETGIEQVTTLNSKISDAYNPCIVSGYFTPEAIQGNFKEVVIATQWDEFKNKDNFIRMNGFRFSSAGNEEIHRFFEKKSSCQFSPISTFFSPVDAVVCDYDGDGYDEVCFSHGLYFSYLTGNFPPTNQFTIEEISIGAFDWTKQGENSIAFPFGWPGYQIIKRWEKAANDFISVSDIFRSRHKFRISSGDINNDGKDEVVVFRSLDYEGGFPPDDFKSGFEILVFSYDTEKDEWNQIEFENMKGSLLDNTQLFTLRDQRNTDYDNLQLNVGDMDNNGCCDIAASLTYKTLTKTCMHYWFYTFELDDMEGLVAKEELNDKIEDTGLKHSMAITNMNSDKYGEIYFVTDMPKLYTVVYDTTRKDFKAIEEKSSYLGNYDSSDHGFTWPVIIPVDIDNDSYWCRYKVGMFDSLNTAPFVNKPVAIINPPPYQQGVNPATQIDIKFNTEHDTSTSVQTQTGYGYNFKINAGVKWLGTKTIFEKTYRDTVMNKKEYYEGNSDTDYWECHQNVTQVIFPTAKYDIYPFRIESFTGEPILSDEGKELFLYILKPRDAGTHLQMMTWENYLTEYEASYGTEEKNALVNFMSPFMLHTHGNVVSFMNNSNPYFIYNNLDKVFPTLEQNINTAMLSYEKEWGKTNRVNESCKRSQRWENKIDIKTGKNWGIVNAGAHFKLNNFTSTKEMTSNTDEDGILVRIKYQGVGEPNTEDDNKYYDVSTFAFWGPEEIGLNGAIIITHQVAEVGSYYSSSAINMNQDHLPKDFSLKQNYPNPFNPTTRICYDLPIPTTVSIGVYNLNGQLVSELFAGKKQAGYHSITWDASENSAGIYFLKLEAENFVQTRKCILLK